MLRTLRCSRGVYGGTGERRQQISKDHDHSGSVMATSLIDGRVLPPQVLLPASNRTTARRAEHARGRSYRFPVPPNSDKQLHLLITNSDTGIQKGPTFLAYCRACCGPSETTTTPTSGSLAWTRVMTSSVFEILRVLLHVLANFFPSNFVVRQVLFLMLAV